MRTKDGTRRRTPGGVFFQLVKERATPKERHRLFYSPRPGQPQPPVPAPSPAHSQASTWEEVQALVQTFPQGEATVKLTLIGRPALEAIQTRPTYVAFRMQGKAPGPLPKGLPPVPDQHPIIWLVVVALRQWNRVQDSLAAHADDKLIIEGHPVVAGEGTHVLLAQTCTSTVQQRVQKRPSCSSNRSKTPLPLGCASNWPNGKPLSPLEEKRDDHPHLPEFDLSRFTSGTPSRRASPSSLPRNQVRRDGVFRQPR